MLRRILAGLIERRRYAASAGAPQSASDAIQESLKQLIAAGNSDEAEHRLRSFLEHQPNHTEALRLLGTLLGSGGRLDEARDYLARALEVDPTHAVALSDMGNVLRLLGSEAEAERCYRVALRLEPSLVNARLNLASLLEQRSPQEGADLYLQVAASDAHPVAVQGAVTALDRMDRSAEARRLCEQVLERFPDHVEAHRSLGFLLLKRDFSAGVALEHFDRALALNPDNVETLANRGIALQDLGRVDEAIATYEAALALEPQHVMARFHRALALLLKGCFAQGWDDYELRLATVDRPTRQFNVPRWRGESLANKTLLVHAEQGLGDEIMFASCIREASALAGRVIVECSPKLTPLFTRSFPEVTICPGDQRDGCPALDALGADAFVPAGSLPMHFRRSRENFPAHRGYLQADGTRVAVHRDRLSRLGCGLKVGVSWRGGTVRSRGPMRTLDLQQLSRVLRVPEMQFVNLQYDSTASELDELRDRHGLLVHHWPEVLENYDDTAALVSALDLVVSVCTAVVHLGGALGRPVWVMAPYSPEWRYGISGESMVWYPSVRVFRQHAPEDWDSVLVQVAGCLDAMRTGSQFPG